MSGHRYRSSTDGEQPVQVVHFQVGGHVLGLSCSKKRWTVTVDDDSTIAQWFMSKVAAWEAGVREADRRDRLGGTSEAQETPALPALSGEPAAS
jgi:hypothetical protein